MSELYKSTATGYKPITPGELREAAIGSGLMQEAFSEGSTVVNEGIKDLYERNIVSLNAAIAALRAQLAANKTTIDLLVKANAKLAIEAGRPETRPNILGLWWSGEKKGEQ